MANFKISGKDVFTQTGTEEPALANNVSIPAVSGVGIKSIKPISNQDLTGTYTEHEMIIGDKFTLTGDLTINDNLVLASLSGSGQDVIIEDDGNGRTITTAGKVIECTTTSGDATVTTTDTSDLRAGKGVTGSGIPASTTILTVTNATTFELSQNATASATTDLTFDTAVFEAGEFLGSAAVPDAGDISGTFNRTVFPSGFPIRIHHSYQTSSLTQTTSTYTVIPGLSLSVATGTTSNKLLIQFNVGGYIDSGNDTVFGWRIYGDGVYIGYGTGTHGEATTAVYGITYNNMPTGSWVGSLMYSPNTTNAKTYDVRAAIAFGSGVLWHPAPSGALTITEIVG